eukprot:Skav218158  [mRNA]  locus=scaffold4591:101282:101809:+ [translate_table: standard]
MIFAQEDILNQKPLAWFPGMAGTENNESSLESTDKGKPGKSVWDRYESQASTAVPGDENYQRLISTDSKDEKIREDEHLSDKAKAVMHQEEYDDESSMLERGFGFGFPSKMNGGIALAIALLAMVCALNSSTKSASFQGTWMILMFASLLAAGCGRETVGATRADASAYACEGDS